MEFEKKKILRKIRLSYRQISNMFNLPSKTNFMIMIQDGGLHMWKTEENNLIDWAGDVSKEELHNKLDLLSGEELVSEDYIVFYGYSLIIETTDKNLKLIKSELDKDHNKSNIIKKLFYFKINPKSIDLNKWKKLFANHAKVVVEEKA